MLRQAGRGCRRHVVISAASHGPAKTTTGPALPLAKSSSLPRTCRYSELSICSRHVRVMPSRRIGRPPCFSISSAITLPDFQRCATDRDWKRFLTSVENGPRQAFFAAERSRTKERQGRSRWRPSRLRLNLGRHIGNLSPYILNVLESTLTRRDGAGLVASG